ncbi:MAG: hypothetical protein F7C07_03050 [Desulfurococcales archaeon]|nr:hypothetical protein [Desulfurococcales archaeon]
MKRLYRVYYNTYDDGKHEEVKRELGSRYGVRVLDHPSRLLPEFRFVELFLDKPGLEEEIANIVREITGSKHVKVDWIDTSR